MRTCTTDLEVSRIAVSSVGKSQGTVASCEQLASQHWSRLLQSSGALPSDLRAKSCRACTSGLARDGACASTAPCHLLREPRVPQPIEPHGLHRSYADSSKSKAEAGVRQRSGQLAFFAWGSDTGLSRTLKLLCCGGLAGGVSRSLTAPIDRLKFLMQVHTASHLTVRQGLALMAREGTLKAYFRGNGTNVMKNVPETALKLTCNDRIKAVVVKDGHNITLSERLTVGAVSGAIAQTVIYPLEVIQTRLAATHGLYKGMLDTITSIWRREGWRTFYRGMTPCLIGILPYAGLDITSFEVMKEWLTEQHGGLPPPYLLLACGMLSSSGAQTLAYPFGFIRTRMQMDGLAEKPYKGMLDCFQQVVSREGWRGLYKGFGMSLAKIAPAAGISWFIFEESKALLGC